MTLEEEHECSERVAFRLTKEERGMLERLSRSAGVSLSNWLRQLIRREAGVNSLATHLKDIT